MEFSPFDPQHWEDPYLAYAELRAQETLPFSRDANAFLASRFDEASEVFKQPEVFSSAGGFNLLLEDLWETIGPRDVLEMLRFLVRARVNPLTLRAAPRSIITADPPHHAPLRQIVNRGFTPRRIAAWEGRIRELSELYLRDVEATERFDLVETLAHPLPMRVIAEMLGVDPGRLADFRRWSTGAIDTLTGSGRRKSPAEALVNGGELFRYLRSVVDARRKEPTDDLISVLIDPAHGEPLDTQGILFFATVLLIAGNETTTNSVGNAVDILLRDRSLLETLAAAPSRIPNFVEETIRLESPFRFMPRRTTCDTILRNTPVPKGSNVLVMIGSANRDERRFPAAERFDLDRDTSGHLAFGHGIHFCLGASLARLEARVALETLIPLLRGRELSPGGGVRADSYLTRGFAKLEVTPAEASAAA